MVIVLSGQSAARPGPAAPTAINPAIAARRERSPMPSPSRGSLAACFDRDHRSRAGTGYGNVAVNGPAKKAGKTTRASGGNQEAFMSRLRGVTVAAVLAASVVAWSSSAFAQA